jgi:uncharacterized membrane protein (UPF0127 family)
MPVKKTIANSSRKVTSRKKLNFSRVAMILFAGILALSFILFSIYTPRKKNAANDRQPALANKAPAFKHEGRVKLMTGEQVIQIDVEIADNDDERTQGLMYRFAMEENQGMFFIFPEEDWRSFWMKNTYISLDIIYLNSNFEIVSIQKYTQPKSTYSLPSEKPAKYVLEVNAGFTDKYGIQPGDKLELSRF